MSHAQHSAPGAQATLDIVIVDYNVGNLVRECVESIHEHSPGDVTIRRIVVVDNASRVPTSECLQQISLPVTVIRNEDNRGFAAACNQGARDSTSDYLLFLNPDTRVMRGSLDVPVAYLEDPAHADVGIAGIQLLDESGAVSRSCSRHPRWYFFLNKALGLDRVSPSRFPSGMMRDWSHDTTRRVDAVIGAFFLVRRTLFEALRGFDERFFVYFEETDFSVRADSIGARTVYLAEAQACHAGCGSSEQVRAHRLMYSLRSRLVYARTHFGRPASALVTVLTLVVEPLARLLLALASRSMSDARETIAAYRLLWASDRLPSAPR
jgi:N-acetylglucosaminyl-diphospho-decaprenol L-rhamnosyltransferase